MKHTVLSKLPGVTVVLMVVVGCGTMDTETQAAHSTEVGEPSDPLGELTAEVTISVCGGSCPGGYYPVSSYQNPNCRAQGFVSTNCSNDYYANIGVCGGSCPGGYYPVSSYQNPNCRAQGFVSTNCSNQFYDTISVCGGGCPGGYYPISSYQSPNCRAQGFVMTTCRR